MWPSMKSNIIDTSDSFLHTAENTSLYFDELSGFVYAAYIGNDLLPVIAKASISDLSNWTIAIIDDFPVLNDSHNGISIGVDPSGNIHTMWNMHGAFDFIYMKTTVPHDITSFESAEVNVEIPSSRSRPGNLDLSYPRFYRCFDRFYLTFRNGTVTDADQYLLTWDGEGWTSFPGRIIHGLTPGETYPTFSPYLGTCRCAPDGSLIIPYTRRVSYHNEGLYLLAYSQDGLLKTYPSTNLARSIANTGMSCVATQDGILVSYLMVSESGYPEVFCSFWDSEKWVTSQVTGSQLPRLRGCPTGPMEGDYRPCDMELQGPWTGLSSDGSIRLIYGHSVTLPGPAWQRPFTILYECLSYDLGETWNVQELSLPVTELTTELSISGDSQKFDLALCQDIKGNIRLLDFREEVVDLVEVEISINFDSRYSDPLRCSLPEQPFYSRLEFQIDLIIRPNDTPQSMGLVDCGGLVGERFFRVLLWGDGRPIIYSQNHLQVLIGNGENWITFWNPICKVDPLIFTHLRLVRSGNSGEWLSLFKLINKEWVLIDLVNLPLELNTRAIRKSKTISGTFETIPFNRSLLIGAIESGTDAIIYPFSGKLEVKVQ